jgi:hypothetical protein
MQHYGLRPNLHLALNRLCGVLSVSRNRWPPQE